ncbi:PREDICTED: uncharacterized protein LOC109586701 [Amphimedon queenslandica]|uniref:Uncharacterized protein n=1 Tax=Amphimedon queenslandica TaxID=400682 RepID=A0AAN0JNT1_AMPQE|nr:PREDICTED: uncharacterized protein LOC109586701 [Amphimedon queenslandica]|eukprot:XP_019858466.1 PREDICTED: uncharacterized protein LOC109586701 [Amphimedon queenslandica]
MVPLRVGPLCHLSLLVMAVKRVKSLVSCFLWNLLGSLSFAAVNSVSNYIVDSTEWQIVLCLIFSVIFAAYKCYCHVKEKQKQNSSQKSESNVCNAAEYHELCESQTRLSRDHETSKRTIADLREENKKLKKQGRDKDLALAQMTKKHAKELRLKEEALKQKNQRKLEILRQREEINNLTDELNEANNEANNQSSSLNEQLIQTQQQSDAQVASLEDKLAKRNEAIASLEDHLSAKDLELSQLQEELTASRSKATSLEQEIRQHEEALKTAIEHVFTNVDDLCAMYNMTCDHLVHHLKCLPPPQLVVCSAPVFQCNNRYSLEGDDVCELSERDDEGELFIPPDHNNSQYTHHALVTSTLSIDEWNYYYYIPMEATSYCSQVSTDLPPLDFIPFSLQFSKYQDRLVVSPVFLPFPPPAPLAELHLIPT